MFTTNNPLLRESGFSTPSIASVSGKKVHCECFLRSTLRTMPSSPVRFSSTVSSYGTTSTGPPTTCLPPIPALTLRTASARYCWRSPITPRIIDNGIRMASVSAITMNILTANRIVVPRRFVKWHAA